MTLVNPLSPRRFACTAACALMASAVLAVPAPAADEAVTVGVIENNLDRIVLDYSFGQFQEEPVNIDGHAFTRIILGQESPKKQTGAPALPDVARSIIIPDDAAMSVQLVDGAFYEIDGVSIAPSKGFILRTVDPADVPYTFGAEYETDAFWPAEPVVLREPYVMRDYRGVVVEVNPFQYNPVTGVLRVYTEMTVEVTVAGPAQVNAMPPRGKERALSLAFHEIYGTHFINYDPQLDYPPMDEEGDMLIICHDPWISNVTPLANHKSAIGINTTVVGVSTIGNNDVAIKNYIQNVYNTSDLAFVLLVGDGPQVDYPTASGGASDPSYALLAGGDSYPDIVVGRFSAETPDQVDTQVQRTVEYEQLMMNQEDWFWKATGIASNQGPGHYGEYDDEHMDLIRDDLLAVGYTEVDQIYDPYGTVAMVNNALNAGRGMVNYCGHGSTTSWGTTGFDNGDVNALVNDNMLPVIVSVACVNGNFPSTTCFAEAWLRATHNGEPTGAVAVYMSSINQSWDPPMEAEDEYVDRYCDQTYHSYGALCFAGSGKMIDEYGSGGVDMFNTWHIFGDPSLRIVGTAGPGFALEATPESQDVCAPDDAVYTVNVSQFLGYTEAVTLSAAGNPAGTTVSFADNPVIPPATTAMIVSGTGAGAPGEYTIEITGTSVDMERYASVGMGLSNSAPAAVILTSPPNGAIDVPRFPTLTWQPSAQALDYELEVALNPTFTNVVYSASTTGTSHTVAIQLETITTYYWHVRADNGCGTSGFSDTFMFETLEQPDYFTEFFDGSGFDLHNWTVEIFPDGSGDYYGICGYEAAGLPTNPAGGTNLSLTDDSFATVSPGTPVHFYGNAYNTFFVGSNGYITFDSGDSDYSESLADHFDQIRISGLFDDLNPASGGTISWKATADRVAVTYQNVPEYFSTGANTFQIEMFFSGEIHITWTDISSADSIVGLSNAGGVPGDYEESDFSAVGPCTVPCPADINGDGLVDVLDLLAMLAAWGPCSGCPEDINGDGLVDVLDLLEVLAAWGPC